MTNYTQNGGIQVFQLNDKEKKKLRAAKKKVSLGFSKFGKKVSGSLANSKKKFSVWNQDRKDNKAAKAILASRQRDDLAGYKKLVLQQRGAPPPYMPGGKKKSRKSKSKRRKSKSKSLSKRRKSSRSKRRH
jgi:hypothetical protein